MSLSWQTLESMGLAYLKAMDIPAGSTLVDVRGTISMDVTGLLYRLSWVSDQIVCGIPRISCKKKARPFEGWLCI